MELSFILYLNSLKQFVHWKTVSEIFRSIPQIPFREYVFESSFNLDIFTEDFTSENEGIQREKTALKFLFLWKTRFTRATAPNKPANSLDFKR